MRAVQTKKIIFAQVFYCLRHMFLLQGFRAHQLDFINAELAGRDVLAVMPTGYGKSLSYQLPALLMEGTALVVSPLVALMNDQFESLLKREISAVRLHGR